LGAFLFIAMNENPTVKSIKLWIFPSLASLVGLLIWNDVNEIKGDVKALMAQSNIDKTRIDNLERQLYKNTTSFPYSNLPVKESPMTSHYAILPNKDLLKKQKHEKILL
jgi:hypothetical protein